MEDHPHPHHIRDDVKHIHPPQIFFAAPFTKNDQGLGVGVCVCKGYNNQEKDAKILLGCQWGSQNSQPLGKLSTRERATCLNRPPQSAVTVVKGLSYMTSAQKGRGEKKISQICGQTVHKFFRQRGESKRIQNRVWTSYMVAPLLNAQ